jgi:hypothetical protein
MSQRIREALAGLAPIALVLIVTIARRWGP